MAPVIDPQNPPPAVPGPGRTVKMDPEGNLQGIETWLQASGIAPNPDNPVNPPPVPAVQSQPQSQLVQDELGSVEPNPNEPIPQARKIKIKVQGQELEVPENEIVTLAQMGMDYTFKTQQLAEKQKALAPYEGVISQLQKDPGLRQVLIDYWNGKTTPAALAKPARQVDPNDPVEVLAQQVLQRVRDEMIPEMQQQNQQTVQNAVSQAITPISQELSIAQTMQKVMTDPLYVQVQTSLGNMVRSLPQSIAQRVFLELDQNPKTYMDSYLQHRAQIVEKLRVAQPPADPDNPNPPALPTRRTTAPLLEPSGGAPPPPGDKGRKERSAKAKANALRSGDVQSLADWLQESGALSHIRLDVEEQ